VTCSKGTYIRVLGEDIGAALGCGAHLQALRRTQVGMLTLDQAWTLDRLERTPETDRERVLAPVDTLLATFPSIRLPEPLAQRFLHGQRLALGKEKLVLPCHEGRVRVYRLEDGQLLGTAQLMPYDVLAPERLVVCGAAH